MAITPALSHKLIVKREGEAVMRYSNEPAERSQRRFQQG